MAETFGARLLAEIEEESLDKLLSNLCSRAPIDQNPRIPAIPFLQDLLSLPDRPIVEASNEQDTLAPAIPSSPSPSLNAADTSYLRPSKLTYTEPPLIEIISSVPAAKSTHLLSYMVICLLQERPNHPKQIVLYFDSAWKISIQQIHTLLLDRSNGDNTAVTEALSRLHIMRPNSSRELLAQLRNVEKYLYSLPDQDCMVAAIILADLSVWYWSERLEEEEKQTYSRESLHAMIVEVVHRLQSRFRCISIVSGLGVVASSGSNRDNPTIRSGLAGAWTKNVDVKLLLARSIDGRAKVNVDATKWIRVGRGDSNTQGKGVFEIHIEEDVVKATQFKHEI